MTTSQQMLDKYMDAELSILDGKTITFNGRSIGYENLQEIRAGRKEWQAKVASESASTAAKKKTIGGLSMATARFDE